MLKLYIVATPIGNLEDITLRALNILKSVDTILCEDTRITSRLLQKYQIDNKKLHKYNDHSNDNDRKKIFAIIQEKGEVVLVSDAGTPNICDPGQVLVKFLSANGVKIVPIPGCSSPIAALSCCNLDVDRFTFIGFLPTTEQKIANLISSIDKKTSFVFFERGSRVIKSLSVIEKITPNRNVMIARELTKIHEEVLTMKNTEIIEYLKVNPEKNKGEFVIIIEKANKESVAIDEGAITSKIEEMLDDGYKSKQIVNSISLEFDINKKLIYQLMLKIKK